MPSSTADIRSSIDLGQDDTTVVSSLTVPEGIITVEDCPGLDLRTITIDGDAIGLAQEAKESMDAAQRARTTPVREITPGYLLIHLIAEARIANSEAVSELVYRMLLASGITDWRKMALVVPDGSRDYFRASSRMGPIQVYTQLEGALHQIVQ